MASSVTYTEQIVPESDATSMLEDISQLEQLETSTMDPDLMSREDHLEDLPRPQSYDDSCIEEPTSLQLQRKGAVRMRSSMSQPKNVELRHCVRSYQSFDTQPDTFDDDIQFDRQDSSRFSVDVNENNNSSFDRSFSIQEHRRSTFSLFSLKSSQRMSNETKWNHSGGKNSKRRFSQPVVMSQSSFRLIINDSEEIITPKRGDLLRDSVSTTFIKRRMNSGRYAFFLEGSDTPLPETSPTQHLVGCVIIVKKREDSRPRLSENRINQQIRSEKRNSTTGVFLSSAPRSSCGTTSMMQGINRCSSRSRRASFNLFPTRSSEIDIQEDKLDRLCETLASYSTSGIPVVPNHLGELYSHHLLDDSKLFLETDWTVLVRDSQNLSKVEIQQQAAIWELVQTEVAYIRQLRLMTEVFAPGLVDLKRKHNDLFAEVDVASVFGNIGEVFYANCYFWTTYIFPVLAMARENGQPMDPSLMKDGFLQIEKIFAPYGTFCQFYTSTVSLVQNLESNNAFAAYLQWANSQCGLNHEGLTGVLCQPFQRIMKYGLILTMIKKCTADPGLGQVLEEMNRAVHNFVEKINRGMELKAQRDRLSILISRIESYDVIELPCDDYDRYLETSHRNLDFALPMTHRSGQRDVIHQGHLRCREGQGKWSEVYCVLLTDIFLICKVSKKSTERLRVFKPPIPVVDFVVKKHSDTCFLGIVLNSVMKCAQNFLVFTADSKRLEEWLTKCRETRNQYINDSCSHPKPTVESGSCSTTSLRPKNASFPSPKLCSSLNQSPLTLAKNRVRTHSSPCNSSPTVTDRRQRMPHSSYSQGSELPGDYFSPIAAPTPSNAVCDRPTSNTSESDTCGTVPEEVELEETNSSSVKDDEDPEQQPHNGRRTRQARRHQTVDAIRDGTGNSRAQIELKKNFSFNGRAVSICGASTQSGLQRHIDNRNNSSFDSFPSSSGVSSMTSQGSKLGDLGGCSPPLNISLATVFDLSKEPSKTDTDDEHSIVSSEDYKLEKKISTEPRRRSLSLQTLDELCENDFVRSNCKSTPNLDDF